ncbi:hypothetical protein M3Y98_00140900 [Aphelenchoides besseyi]|nr:hypothetical protein M3Y98_00140900 [Aphelenchoides besseyi]
MSQRLYIASVVLALAGGVCGFYILASRDDVVPFDETADYDDLLSQTNEQLPLATTQRVLLDEQLPGMAVLQNSVDEDEAELASRAEELRDELLGRRAAAELARQYAQTIESSDFSGVIRTPYDSEDTPVELIKRSVQMDDFDLPYLYTSQKRSVPQFIIIE